LLAVLVYHKTSWRIVANVTDSWSNLFIVHKSNLRNNLIRGRVPTMHQKKLVQL
jgi:hypothetical protein